MNVLFMHVGKFKKIYLWKLLKSMQRNFEDFPMEILRNAHRQLQM